MLKPTNSHGSGQLNQADQTDRPSCSLHSLTECTCTKHGHRICDLRDSALMSVTQGLSSSADLANMIQTPIGLQPSRRILDSSMLVFELRNIVAKHHLSELLTIRVALVC